MKRYAVSMILGLMALSAAAQEASNEVKVVPASPVEQATAPAPSPVTASADAPALPEGVTTTQHPLKKAYLAKSGMQPALFRPNPNMPEITNEDLMRGMADSGKSPGKAGRQIIGYMPKLRVLPCAKGCEGRDYDKAVKALIKGFHGDGKAFEERGEMIVQVRWFNARPFLMRQMPYSADEFGISFMLEGKVVSLGKNSGVGKSVDVDDMAREIGARLAMDLAFGLGTGIRSNILLPAHILEDGSFASGVSNLNTGMNVMLGVTDTRSRVEPATEAHANLLPAIDGIRPNEIAPVKQMYFLNSLIF